MKPVLIKTSLLEDLQLLLQQRGFFVELGGLLLGQRKQEGIQIDVCTFPKPKDRSTYNRFYRRDPKHQELALKMWKASNKTMDWCGEWHSHPELKPKPSSIDQSLWKSQVNDRQRVSVG